MIAWLTANYLTILVAAAVCGLVALCLRNILPRKGKPSGCGGCNGCNGCSGGCAHYEELFNQK